MSSTTIHYINANHKRFDDSLVRQSDLDDDRFVYSQCPVYNHKTNRVFVGTSPIDFMQILRIMPSVDIIEFGIEDIVRSGFVKEYLLAKLEKTM